MLLAKVEKDSMDLLIIRAARRLKSGRNSGKNSEKIDSLGGDIL